MEGPERQDMERWSRLREEYAAGGLDAAELADDPIAMFTRWFDDAVAARLPEPNAMVVSTADASGRPSSRMVLLKGLSDAGWVFFTNLESRKGDELSANPACALLFPWHPLQRQVRVTGTATPISRDRVDDYFATRPRGSQLGAWASPQSREVADRDELDRRYDEVTARFRGADVPAPPHWGGFEVAPDEVEFWQGRPGRMHDRLVYRRAGGTWRTHRLAP